MRIALDQHSTALDLMIKFADAPQELAVELALVDKCLSLSGERRSGSGQFFGQLTNLRLLRVRDSGLSIFNPLLDLLKIAEDSTHAHRVKGKDVISVNQHESL
ncbi:MAG TPA: hypothetical protein VF708_05325 [Pyrinomonadaceae bacterium]